MLFERFELLPFDLIVVVHCSDTTIKCTIDIDCGIRQYTKEHADKIILSEPTNQYRHDMVVGSAISNLISMLLSSVTRIIYNRLGQNVKLEAYLNDASDRIYINN